MQVVDWISGFPEPFSASLPYTHAWYADVASDVISWACRRLRISSHIPRSARLVCANGADAFRGLVCRMTVVMRDRGYAGHLARTGL
jgi:hypothetical protein